jgi:proteasome accessory factor B
VVGEVKTVGRPGAVVRPAGVNLMEHVLGGPQDPRQTTSARLWVAKGRAQGVRRQATVVGERELDGELGDEVTVELRFPESAAGWLAGHGMDVVVLEPDVLRKSVRERLLGVLDAHTRGAGL